MSETRRSARFLLLALLGLEKKDDEQDDQDQKEHTTTDVHLQPPFRAS